MRYPGGKNGAGTYQRLINLVPLHRVYIEAFAGSASLFFHKREAQDSFLLDRDREQCRALRSRLLEREATDPPMEAINRGAKVRVIVADALAWLVASSWAESPETFLYCDPPYLASTRRDPERAIYKFEMSEADHKRLLELLCGLKCKVMLSGYSSLLYRQALKASEGWREVQFRVMTRGGNSRLESLWMNYPQPYELHDYSYLGENYRKRQDFKRLRARWLNKISAMDDLRRYALLSALREARPELNTIEKGGKANGKKTGRNKDTVISARRAKGTKQRTRK